MVGPAESGLDRTRTQRHQLIQRGKFAHFWLDNMLKSERSNPPLWRPLDLDGSPWERIETSNYYKLRKTVEIGAHVLGIIGLPDFRSSSLGALKQTRKYSVTILSNTDPVLPYYTEIGSVKRHNSVTTLEGLSGQINTYTELAGLVAQTNIVFQANNLPLFEEPITEFPEPL